MSATQPRDPHFSTRLDEPIPPLTNEQLASVTAQAARLARETGLTPDETVELVQMLGLDQAPFVQRVLAHHSTAHRPTRPTTRTA